LKKHYIPSLKSILILKTTRVDITPDKSLIKKLGLTGYRTEQALAELVDNSIDARIESTPEAIAIKFDFVEKTIEVSDNGTGMNLEELGHAMIIARGLKSDEKLGKFGLGMKSACSSLGKKFTITTTKLGSRTQCIVEYDEEKWLGDKSLDWKNFEIRQRKQEDDWHGTRINISKLNVSLYPNKVTTFKEKFGIRYGPYLEDGQITLKINSITVPPANPPIREETMKEISIELPSGNIIKGWIALVRKRSVKGDYGIHLFKNNRLIKAYDKFGIRFHPQIANVVGRLNLDHVPVNFHKSEFLQDSDEYNEAWNAFSIDANVRETLREAAKTQEVTSDANSVLQYLSGNAKAGYLRKVRSDIARKILGEKEEISMRSNFGQLLFSFSDDKDPLYTLKKEGQRYRVIISRNNDAFNYVKNPLLLIGLIGVETRLALQRPKLYEQFLESRNTQWSEFIREWSNKETGSGESRDIEPPSYRNYGLTDELVEIHEVLKNKYENKFQFTALATLNRYLHNDLGKIMYTLQTIPGSAQYLVDLLKEIVGNDILLKNEFTVLPDLKRNELQTALRVSNKSRFIIVRETSEYLGFTIANPEKAWMDLFIEIDTKRLPVAKAELRYVLEALMREKLVTKENIMSLLERHKRGKRAIPIIKGVL
jgi:hypothetical protein